MSKFLYIKAVSLCILLLPNQLFAKETTNRVYVMSKYVGNFFNNFSKITRVMTSGNNGAKFATRDVNGLVISKEPAFDIGYLGFGAGIGYVNDNFRVEVEFNYSKTDIKDSNYKNKENARHVEILRPNQDNYVIIENGVIPFDNRVPPYYPPVVPPDLKLSKLDVIQQYRCKSSCGIVFNPIIIIPPNTSIFTITFARVSPIQLENDGISAMTGLINVYYDMSDSARIVPYVGAGVGIARIEYLGLKKFGLAYSGKVGINLNVSKQLRIFGNVHYTGVLNNKFNVSDLPNNLKFDDKIYYDKNLTRTERDSNGKMVYYDNDDYYFGTPTQYYPFLVAGNKRIKFEKRYGVFGLETGVAFKF